MPIINRRTLVVAAALAAATMPMPRNVFAQAPAQPPGPFIQPPLPFLEPQLAPTISNRTVTLHFGRHHAAYFTALNSLTKDT